MKTIIRLTTVTAVAVILAVAGCARQSQSKTDSNVADAQSQGTKSIAAARRDASDKMADDQKDLTKAQDKANRDSAESNRTITVAEAEARHKVEIERCDGLSTDARKDCKALADTDLVAAKARADAARGERGPTG